MQNKNITNLSRSTPKDPTTQNIPNTIRYWDIKGAFEIEDDNGIPFRWITQEATVIIPKNNHSYLVLKLYSPFKDLEQIIEIRLKEKKAYRIALLSGWHIYAIKKGDEKDIHITAKKIVSPTIDRRNLALRISSIETTNILPREVEETNKFVTMIV
ncbi:MAG: hypothetical protein WC916_06740 [Candidatus Woesearchaeota archaeon]